MKNYIADRFYGTDSETIANVTAGAELFTSNTKKQYIKFDTTNWKLNQFTTNDFANMSSHSSSFESDSFKFIKTQRCIIG